MGQFLSSTFLEGSPDAVWHNMLGEGEHKGAGEAALVLQDQVMYGEERRLIKTHGGVHVAGNWTEALCKEWTRQNPGGGGVSPS